MKNKNRPGFRKPPFSKKKNQKSELRLYDNADMARLFKVTSRTLQRWRDDGEIPFSKIGGKIYYLASKVDQLMEGKSDREKDL